jgi:hypothetical protein
MSAELILGHRSDSVRAKLTAAPAWNAYAAELRRVLGMVIENPGGADSLCDVIGEVFLLADKAMGNWCAVVPDPDGVSRGSGRARENRKDTVMALAMAGGAVVAGGPTSSVPGA